MVIGNEQISFKTRKSRTDFVNLHYSGYLIGRYVLSHSMRYAGYYQNKITFSWLLEKD